MSSMVSRKLLCLTLLLAAVPALGEDMSKHPLRAQLNNVSTDVHVSAGPRRPLPWRQFSDLPIITVPACDSWRPTS